MSLPQEVLTPIVGPTGVEVERPRRGLLHSLEEVRTLVVGPSELEAERQLCLSRERGPLGGCLNRHASAWQELFPTDKWLMTTIDQGLDLEFLHDPAPVFRPVAILRTARETEAYPKIVSDMVAKDFVEEGPTSCVLPTFLEPKPGGEFRFIYDARHVNDCVEAPHFKMEGLHTVRQLLREGDFFVKVDLKSAYSQLLVGRRFRRYLGFHHQGRVWRYRVLPFGLSLAPYAWSRLMKAPVGMLRKAGIRCVAYLDDLLIMSSSLEDAYRDALYAMRLLSGLGFRINWDKSVLSPAQTVVFLGFRVCSRSMTLTITPAKRATLRRDIRHYVRCYHHQRPIRTRQWASFIGSLQAIRVAVPFACLYLVYFDQAKLRAVTQDGWGGHVLLDHHCFSDLEFWRHLLAELTPSTLLPFSPEGTLFTDASDFAWGAHLQQGLHEQRARGIFVGPERDRSINAKELIAVRDALLSLMPSRCSLILRADNMTVVADLARWRAASCHLDVVREIATYCRDHQVRLQPIYIRSADNCEADRLSRIRERSDYMLNPVLFRCLEARWGPHSVDAFATRQNRLLSRYWSRWHDPYSAGADALLQDWQSENAYANPPFCLLTRVLGHIRRQGATATIIAPWWPTQPWFPDLLSLLVEPPLLLPAWDDTFLPVSTANARGIGVPPWAVAACRVSGRELRQHVACRPLEPEQWCPGDVVRTYFPTARCQRQSGRWSLRGTPRTHGRTTPGPGASGSSLPRPRVSHPRQSQRRSWRSAWPFTRIDCLRHTSPRSAQW